MSAIIQALSASASAEPAAFAPFRFWLGTDLPGWLAHSDVPLFVSRRSLVDRKSFPRANCCWALDSGAFTELDMYGTWQTTPRAYAEMAQRCQDQAGNLCWAAPMDYPCEERVLHQTGLTIQQHQQLTTESYLQLRTLAPEIAWVPVLQGWEFDDYLAHLDQYSAAGIDLARLPLVGIGSICRRQHTRMAEELFRHLHGLGIRIHAFGLKIAGVKRSHPWLTSSDSMAWSYTARRQKLRLPGCQHKSQSCNRCFRWALLWRAKVLAGLREKPQDQRLLWEVNA